MVVIMVGRRRHPPQGARMGARRRPCGRHPVNASLQRGADRRRDCIDGQMPLPKRRSCQGDGRHGGHYQKMHERNAVTTEVEQRREETAAPSVPVQVTCGG